MCGRFAQTNLIKSTTDIVKTVIGDSKIIDNYNISPGNQAAVIKKFTNGKALEFLVWSITPDWSSSIANFKPLHNTRIESLEKPYFKKIATKNRIIIPCSYYYEWSKGEGNKKKPYCFKIEDEPIMFFCGVYDKNQFSIFTKDADPDNSTLHHRQPVIINRSKINDFLNLKNKISEVLASIKSPKLKYWEISTEINNPKNNNKELINPLSN